MPLAWEDEEKQKKQWRALKKVERKNKLDCSNVSAVK